MKAAVLHNFGETPRYEEFPDPTPGTDELLVQVQAVELANALKAMVAGTHYASRQFFPHMPAVVGFSGVGMLEDGQLMALAAYDHLTVHWLKRW